MVKTSIPVSLNNNSNNLLDTDVTVLPSIPWSIYCPGPDRLFSINFLLTKHIHHYKQIIISYYLEMFKLELDHNFGTYEVEDALNYSIAACLFINNCEPLVARLSLNKLGWLYFLNLRNLPLMVCLFVGQTPYPQVVGQVLVAM